MKKIIIGFVLFWVSQFSFAGLPCDFNVNWGYIDNLTTLDGIRFKLIGGQTFGSSTKEYILPIVTTNDVNGVLFRQNLELINTAFFTGKQIKLNTKECYSVPSVGTITYIRISR